MPKIIIHAANAAFNAEARRAIAGEMTDLALDCEALPKSPFVRSTVWTYFNEYPVDMVFMGAERATTNVVSIQIFVIEGGLDGEAKARLIEGATRIVGQHLSARGRVPVYIVIQEVPEANWGIFGQKADLAAFRASAPDAPAL